jgi:acetyl esterase
MSKNSEYYFLKTLVSLPKPLRRLMSAETDVVIRGEPLDPQTQSVLALNEKMGRPTIDDIGRKHGVKAARGAYRKFYRLATYDARNVPVTSDDLIVPGAECDLRARLYTPAGGSDRLMVYFHGGGFVIGDIDAYDHWNRFICDQLQAKVLFAEYRMAPEDVFPAAVHDATAVLQYAHRAAGELGVDAGRIAVGGDSAGGTLSITSAHEAGVPLKAAWLICPGVDGSQKYPSNDDFATGFGLSQPMIDWFFGTYMDGQDESNPLATPINLPHLDRLPPSRMTLGGYDPLLDQGLAFVDKLKAAGVEVSAKTWPGQVHNFTQLFSIVRAGKQATIEDCAWVRARLEG